MDEPRSPDDYFFEGLARETDEAGPETAVTPSRLKSSIYSALVSRMESGGPLLDLGKTRQRDKLCVFEGLVQIAPLLPESTGCVNFCRVCHARVLAESMERAPIYWSNCPYVRFQNR